MKKYLFILAVLFVVACTDKETNELVPFEQITITCDAENVLEYDFVTNDIKVGGGLTQSDIVSRSGNFSSQISKNSPYGFTYTFDSINPGDVIDASVWVNLNHSTAQLIITDKTEGGLSEIYEQVEIVEGEWGMLKAYFIANKFHEKITVFVLNFGDDPAYTDDFNVCVSKNNVKPHGEYDALEITLSTAVLDTLSNRRDIALEQGVITKNLKKYVDATIRIDGVEVPIDLRIKGDWTDHLRTDKWSFRIKVKGANCFMGMKSFSIQNPSTRSFMDEWFAHKIFERENVLTTRYRFIPVIINGEKKGVYAVEEHFDKQLLEFSQRREGPIVKFDESGVWQLHMYEENNSEHINVPMLESAEITPFKSNRTSKSQVLSSQFKKAQQQMTRLRDGDVNVYNYLDVDAFVKYIALSDVLNGKHGQIWHNLRNYFNPVTQKLEPIAYDCFVERKQILRNVSITGLDRKNKKFFTLLEGVLNNSEAEALYLEYLKEYTDPSFLENAIQELSVEIQKAEKLLQFEYPGMRLDQDILQNNCEVIRTTLSEYEEFTKQPNAPSKTPRVYDPLPENLIFTDIALKAYIRDTNVHGKYEVYVENYHTADIEIVGYAIKRNKDSIINLPNFTLKKFVQEPDQETIRFSEKPKVIFYTASNCGDRIFKYKIGKWSEPEVVSDSKVETGNRIIYSGSIEVDQDIIIPRGGEVIFEPGTILTMNKGAGFVSESPVSMNGTIDQPIVVKSDDGTASGFTVIASGTSSSMTHVQFTNLNTMHKNNWVLTGAVTFYESDVTIINCIFEKNNCEDGLNLVRCSFNMLNSTVRETFSDGFDADFCSGILSNSIFEATGNDCIDFSGSKITINDCKIYNSGDKGISGGEGSTLIVNNCSIDGTKIAVAAKDFSTVEFNKGAIRNSDFAFAAFRKKPEYGPASITASELTVLSVKEVYLLEKGSKLILEGVEHEGTEVFDIEEMYSSFQK